MAIPASPPQHLMDQSQLAWSLFGELRKEILEAQRIRAQVIGFKITFVSTGVGLIVATQTHVPPWLLAVPAFAAVFFDLLLLSYSFSIKRIAHYLKTYVEPKLRSASSWPTDDPLWEGYLAKTPETKQRLALVGNLGITLLVSVVAVAYLLQSLPPLIAAVPSLALAALLAYDFSSHFLPFRRLRTAAQLLPPAAPPAATAI